MKYEFEYVYLLQVYPANDLPVYKYGKTTRAFTERYKEYTKVSPKIILVLSCEDCATLEKNTLKEIRLKYNMRNDLGKEYFEGPLSDVTRTVINKYRDHVRAKRNGIDDEINRHGILKNAASVSSSIEELGETTDTERSIVATYAIDADNRKLLRELYYAGTNIFGENYENYLTVPSSQIGKKKFLATMIPDKLELSIAAGVLPSTIVSIVNDQIIGSRLSEESIKECLLWCIDNLDHELFSELADLCGINPVDYTSYIKPIDQHLFLGAVKEEEREESEENVYSGHEKNSHIYMEIGKRKGIGSSLFGTILNLLRVRRK